MSEIKQGTRVRVTYEGEVKVATRDGVTIAPDDFRQSWQHLTTRAPQVESPSRVQIEVIAPPRREFEDGALYLNPDTARVWRYHKSADRWSEPGRGNQPYITRNAFTEDGRGLVKLVPAEG